MNRNLPALKILVASVVLALSAVTAFAAQAPKEAGEFTVKANEALLKQLPFGDKQDFEDAQRGFIAPLKNGGVLKDANGQVFYNAQAYKFPLDAPAPATVNPSFWRQSQLTGISGLFQVAVECSLAGGVGPGHGFGDDPGARCVSWAAAVTGQVR